MSRRRRLLDEEDETGWDSENSEPGTPAKKKRRSAKAQEDKKRMENSLFSSSNDSGFLSAPVVTPEHANAAASTETSRLVKEVQSPAGMITRIRLKNFMCHGNLDVELGKKVTFITGRNGSGKSAILAGLVLGLGGKPNALNRGNTAKAYVRSGNASAEILITFDNTGQSAYQQDTYGKSITIERTLFASGKSTYKIKNEKGAVVSERCDGIPPILRAFNVQLDNPVMILTQDTSRTFLNSADPSKLYLMFYRGTQLEQMDDNFKVVLENQALVDDAVRQQEQKLVYLSDDIQQLRDRIKLHDEVQKDKDRFIDLSCEYGWALVRDAEKELLKLQKQGDDATQKESSTAGELEQAKDKEKETAEKIETETAELESFKVEAQNLRQKVSALQHRVDVAENDGRKKKDDVIKLEREIVELEAQKTGLEEHIRRLQEGQMDEERRQRRVEKEKQLEDVKLRLAQAAASRQNHEKESVQWQNSCQTHSSQRDSLRIELQRIDRQRNTAVSSCHALQMSKSNALARFGREAPELRRLIEEALARNQFRRRPRGPIGAFVSLQEERWAVAVESCLSRSLLNAYICHDFNDNRLLESLMQRCGYTNSSRPTIYVRNFGDERTYDVSAAECYNDQYPTVLSVLNIEDNVIRNLLIDQRRIETVLLFSDEAEMREVMRRQAPRKATSAYGIAGGNFVLHPTFRYYPSQLQGGARFLVKSVDEQIHRLQGEIQRHENEKSGIQRQITEVEKQIRTEEQQKSRCESAIHDCQRQIQTANRTIRELEEEINELVPTNVDTVDLALELDGIGRQVGELRTRLETARSSNREAVANVEELKAQLGKKKREERSFSTKLSDLQGQVDRLITEKNRCRDNVERVQRALRGAETLVQNAKERVQKKEEEVQDLTEKARELNADRHPTLRDCEEITREMKRIKAALDLFEKEKEKLEDLLQVLDEKVGRAKTVQAHLDEIKSVYLVLKKAVCIRDKGYPIIRLITQWMMCTKFIQYLNARHYGGKLDIDWKQEKLTISVETSQDSTGSADSQASRRPKKLRHSQDLRGLSGGERSFSTVAFIMALWTVIETPSCWMDEFDVFMDHCSRRMVMELLLKFALEHRPEYQFVFLTPQSVSELPFGIEGLRVCELKAPRDERRQEKDKE